MEGKPQIVVVEDDASVSHAIERLLSTSGWASRSFASAEAFLAWEDRDTASLLILDVQLPGMSGLDLQQTLMTAGHCPPVVFITGQDRPHFRSRAESACAAAYLTKPFTGKELTEIIRRHLEVV